MFTNINALRELCGSKTTARSPFPSLAKLAADPAVPRSNLGILGRAGQGINNAAGAANHWTGTNLGFAWPTWREYSQRDGLFWHPSKSTEDNLRGYAEAGGETLGGAGGAIGGFFAGGAVGGPAAPATAVGGTIVGGYAGGKSGKSLGRNIFNWAWGSNGTQDGVDSLGRNTGYGIDNGAHGNDFKPQLHDVGYLIPAAGGALKVPLNQGMKPTLKPMTSHLTNLAGRRGQYTPAYESLPWTQRYALGPNAKLHPYVNTAKPAMTDADPNMWYHGRRLNAETGQFSGTNIDEVGRLIPDRNLRYQLADDPMEQLYAGGMDTESFLVQKGVPRDSALRLLKNKGEIGAHFGKGYPYDYPDIHTAIPPNAKPGWTRIGQPEFLDIRALTDAQAARRSLTGSRVENGRRVPIGKNDGNAPSYSGINVEAIKRELSLHPKNKALGKLHDRLRQPYTTSGVPEFTVAPSKMPTQGYTKIKAPGFADDQLYPWMIRDETPALAPSNLLRNGMGAPYSVLGERAFSDD